MRTALARILAAGAVAFALAPEVQGALGDLDPSFGTGGVSLFGYGFGIDVGKGVVRQPDGKLVIAAQTADDFTGNPTFTVIRLNSDGTRDTTFGPKGNGAVRIATGGQSSGASGVALQADGRIVAAGFSFGSVTYDFAVARLNANGTLDTTFNGTGVRVLDVAAGSDDQAYAIAVQPDGKIVVGGKANLAGVIHFGVIRLNPDASLDTTFDGDGIAFVDSLPAITDSINVPATPHMLALQTVSSVTRVVLAGFTNTAPTHGFVIRLAPDGSKDVTFGTSGLVTFDFFAGNGEFHAVFVDPLTQQIVVTGKELNAGSDNLTVARMNPDGTLDAAFAGTGKTSILFPATALSGESVTVDPFNGGVIVTGLYQTGTGPVPIVARYTAVGAPDSNFPALPYRLLANAGVGRDIVATGAGNFVVVGENTGGGGSDVFAQQLLISGLADTSFGGSGNGIAPGDYSNLGSLFQSVALQPDGKIITEAFVNSGSGFIGGLARVNPDGTRDLTFGNKGQATFDVGNGYNIISNIFSVAGNKMVVTGFGHDTSARETFLAARFNTDGSIDPTFSTNGVFLTNFSGLFDEARAATVTPSGSIVLAGPNGSATTSNVLVLKLTANGFPDTTFSANGYFNFPVEAGFNHQVGAAAALPDESVLLGGQVFDFGAKHYIAKVLPNGSLDTTFGTGGIYLGQAIPSNIEQFEAILLQPDGKIIGVGMSNTEGTSKIMLVRLLANGTRDPSFGTGGISLRTVQSSGSVLSAVLQADGKIVTIGSETGPTFNPEVAFYRFNADGTPDASFGTGGTRHTLLGASTNDVAGSAVLQPDGRLVIAGSSFGRLSTLARIGLAAAAAPSLQLGATQIGFGNRGLNTNTPVPVTLRNVGNAPLVISLITAEGQGFSQANTCTTAPIAPAGTCSLTVRFMPTAAGISSGLITITSNSALSPQSIAISGTGVDLSDPLGDADGDGVPNGIEASVNLNPLSKDNDIFGQARLFAMQQYRDFLGREGDSGGVEFWIAQLNTGAQTRGQMIENFFGSAEFQGVGAPVARLYFAYFLRIPDYGGLTFWIKYYRGGRPLSEVSDAFAASAEFTSRYGALTNDQFVDLVYQNVLGRPADAGGKTFWIGQLNAGMSRGTMMIGFSESAEYQAAIFNSVYVTMMYVGMLHRSPDPGGFSFWTGYMNAGNAGIALINGFVGATEYRNRFLP